MSLFGYGYFGNLVFVSFIKVTSEVTRGRGHFAHRPFHFPFALANSSPILPCSNLDVAGWMGRLMCLLFAWVDG